MVLTAHTPEAIICLISSILCLLTGVILLLYSAGNIAQRFLAASYLAFAGGMAVIWLIYSLLIFYVPYFYRTGNIFLLLYMPLSWLYVRASVSQKRLTWWHLAHFLWALVYIVDFFPFFMYPGPQKLAIIHAELSDLDLVLRFRHGWLWPGKYQIPTRTLQMTFYWIWQIRLLASRQAAQLRKNPLWLRWQIIYVSLQLPIFLPALIIMVSGGHGYTWATSIPPAATSVLSALTLFFSPQILYNVKPKLTTSPVIKPKLSFNTSYMVQLDAQLVTVMQDQQPFLDPDYTLKDLADALKMPVHKLSAYINQVIGKNFSDYLNHWRIEYCLDLIRERRIGNLNLNGIATKCGFNNRNTFSSAFKKVTGKSPSEYLQDAV